jgi:hypothetical protein
LIYGAPVFFPELTILAEIGKLFAEILSSANISGSEVLYSGGGLTVVGLLHKLQKLFKGEPLEDEYDGGNGEGGL